MKDFIANILKKKLSEVIELPVEVGDTVLMGKFKNKKIVVKDIDWDDEKGDLKINGKPALKFRLSKKDDLKEALNVSEKTTKKTLTYRFEHLDSYDGQDNWELGLYIPEGIVGLVQYVTFEGEITISDILVRPEYRRKGLASRMVKAVKNKHPELKYRPSMKTDLGAKFKHKDIEDMDVMDGGLIGEDYPQSWDIEEFKKLTSFSARIRYCEEHLQRISSGSSRIVYKIDDEKVLKLAKNKKGLAQNEVEVDYSNEPYIDDILAKIYEYNENYLWVEMELAKKLKVADFKRIVGFDFKDYIQAVQIIGSQANPRLNGRVNTKIDPDLLEAMYEDEFISGIFDYIGNYNIPVGDLMRMSTYGVVKGDGEERVVVIDYGIDNDVYDSYYS